MYFLPCVMAKTIKTVIMISILNIQVERVRKNCLWHGVGHRTVNNLNIIRSLGSVLALFIFFSFVLNPPVIDTEHLL